MSWRHFWRAELKRRGLSDSKAPRVYERYPWLAAGRPGDLPHKAPPPTWVAAPLVEWMKA